MNGIASWLNDHMVPCFWKKYLGIECPGCGMQRSLVALFEGDLKNCLYLYPALFPLIIMFCVLLLHLKFNFKNGALFLKLNFIFTTVIIVSNYLIKLF